MRRALAILIALLLLAPALCAQSDKTVNDLRARAAALHSEGKRAEASRLLSDACQLAALGKYIDLQAHCLLELGTLHSDFDWEQANSKAVTPLFFAAAAKAAEAGDIALEQIIWDKISWAPGDGDDSDKVRESAQLQELDCALVSGDFDAIEGMTFFTSPEFVAPFYALMDLNAEATIDLNNGNADGARKCFNDAITQADKLKAVRFAAQMRMRLAPIAATREEAWKLLDVALEFYWGHNDRSAQARALLAKDRFGFTKDADKIVAVRKALTLALEARDNALIERAALWLAELVPAEASALKENAAAAKLSAKRALLDEGRAAASSFGGPSDELIARLKAAAEKDDECKQLLYSLIGAPTPPPSDAEKKKFLEAFQKAIAKADQTANLSVVLAEVTGRREVIPALVDAALQTEGNVDYTFTVENLATHDDWAQLVRLLAGGKTPIILEAAAAGMFKVATKDDVDAVRKVIETTKDPVAVIYLNGVLAKFGDAKALAALKSAVKGENPAAAIHAGAILGALGFASPLARLNQPDKDLEYLKCRALGRTPANWGGQVLVNNKAMSPFWGARSQRRRNDPRQYGIFSEENDINEFVWGLPTSPAELRRAGLDGICGYSRVIRSEGIAGDYFAWMAEHAGLDLPEAKDRLKKAKDSPFTPLALTDLEQKKLGVIGGPQCLSLGDLDESGYAACNIMAYPQMGELRDNVLKAPFVFKETIDANGSGLAGAMYKGVIVPMSASDLLDGATINIPGYPAIEGKVSLGQNGQLTVTAELPVVVGEGLGDQKTIPLEKLAAGTVTLKFKFCDAKGSLTFPLALVIPPKKDKPDLVAEEIVIEPPVPGQDEEATITLKARNMGKAIDEGKVCNVRFQIKNPQSSGGYRTLGAVIFNSSGWRPGEWREFNARPKFVKDYYMNRYSPTWTLEIGDDEITVTIDADGAQEDADRSNNTISKKVPLYMKDDEAQKLSEEELLNQLKPLMQQVSDAKTATDAFMCIGLMKTFLQRTKVRTPEIDATRAHIEAAVNMKVFSLRSDAAFARLDKAKADNKLDRATLISIAGDMATAQKDLLDSGVPVATDTLTYCRNRTLLAANTAKAIDQWYGDLGPVVGTSGEGAPGAKAIGDTLGRIDGVLLLARYCRDSQTGNADSADVLDAASNLIPLNAAPGLSNLHKAMLDAEIKYVDKGFRKEANALEALSDLISGKEGAQDRLDKACADVKTHIEAGPFNKNSMKEIAKGWVKDVPVLGQLADIIWSWK